MGLYVLLELMNFFKVLWSFYDVLYNKKKIEKLDMEASWILVFVRPQ